MQTLRDCSNLVCEKSILAGEREALNNSTGEVLQGLGGEAPVQRLVAAVQLPHKHLNLDSKLYIQKTKLEYFYFHTYSNL